MSIPGRKSQRRATNGCARAAEFEREDVGMSLSAATRRRGFPPRVALTGLLAALAAGTVLPAGAEPEMPPPAVVVVEIAEQEAGVRANFVARVEAIEAVDVRARVRGFLESVEFSGGQRVAAGQPLFRIERDPYEAQLASARAQLARARATRTETRDALARSRELHQRGTLSEAALDQAVAADAMAEADVAAAGAAVRSAELDVGYTAISSPIDGRIGRPLVTRGNLVGPDSGPLARIVQLDPIRVVFSVRESAVVSLRQAEMVGGPSSDTAEGYLFRLLLPNGDEYAHAGALDFIDNEVDPSTGTVAIRAVYPNPDDVLVPGLNVTMLLTERDPGTFPVVPQAAIQQDREGRYVYVLGDGETVSRRAIVTGERTTGGFAVTEGLAAGEVVVVQGIQRLRPGIQVRPSRAEPP